MANTGRLSVGRRFERETKQKKELQRQTIVQEEVRQKQEAAPPLSFHGKSPSVLLKNF